MVNFAARTDKGNTKEAPIFRQKVFLSRNRRGIIKLEKAAEHVDWTRGTYQDLRTTASGNLFANMSYTKNPC